MVVAKLMVMTRIRIQANNVEDSEIWRRFGCLEVTELTYPDGLRKGLRRSKLLLKYQTTTTFQHPSEKWMNRSYCIQFTAVAFTQLNSADWVGQGRLGRQGSTKSSTKAEKAVVGRCLKISFTLLLAKKKTIINISDNWNCCGTLAKLEISL